MEYKEHILESKLICDKGDIVLNEIKVPLTNDKIYNLQVDLKNVDPTKVNINTLLSTAIYELIEKLNPDLIEKIYILNEVNDLNETDICILLQHIAKEVGIKQKYVLFRTTKSVNNTNNSVIFYNKDLKYVNPELSQSYLKSINLNTSKYEPMIFEFGKTQIYLSNIENNLQLINTENIENLINIKFSVDFQLTIIDNLPIYMENLIGLMFKKMFYNIKEFITKIK